MGYPLGEMPRVVFDTSTELLWSYSFEENCFHTNPAGISRVNTQCGEKTHSFPRVLLQGFLLAIANNSLTIYYYFLSSFHETMN